MGRRRLTPMHNCAILALYRQGLSLAEIARRVGVSDMGVASSLKRQVGYQTAPCSGFRGMSPEKQRAIARLGGKASHAAGTAHTFTSQEAAAAGAKGGRAAHAKGTAHKFTSEEGRAARRKRGRTRARQRKK
jgi:general stress protein YciG